jgi:hypothetical protein
MNKSSTISFQIIIYSFLLIYCSCTQPGDVPAYLQINSFAMHADPNTQGSSSSNYTDVWVSVDGNAQGVYQMPTQFPVLSPGTHKLVMRAGIMLNGIAASRAPYAVVLPFDTNINLPGGKMTSFTPNTTYAPNTHFAQKEDFDHTGISFEPSPGLTDTTVIDTLITADAFEGKLGAVYLDATRPLFQYESVDSFPLPGANAPCYVELNYKCNNEFTVGTIAYTDFGTSTTPILTIRTTDTWKKIYVNLTPTVTGTLYANNWKIYLYALQSNGLSTAYLYFDNIKVVY